MQIQLATPPPICIQCFKKQLARNRSCYAQFRSTKGFEIQIEAFMRLFSALKSVRIFMMDRESSQVRTYGSPEFLKIFEHLKFVMEHDRPFLPKRSNDPGATLVNLLSASVENDETVGNKDGFEFQLVCLIDEYLEEMVDDLKISYGKRLYKGI